MDVRMPVRGVQCYAMVCVSGGKGVLYRLRLVMDVCPSGQFRLLSAKTYQCL